MDLNVNYRLKTKKINNDSRYEILCSVNNSLSWEPVIFCLHCYYSKPRSMINERFHNGSTIIISKEGIINQSFICNQCQDYHQELFSNLKNNNKKDKNDLKGKNDLKQQDENQINFYYILNYYPGVSRLVKKITRLGFKYPSEILTISTVGFIFGKLLK